MQRAGGACVRSLSLSWIRPQTLPSLSLPCLASPRSWSAAASQNATRGRADAKAKGVKFGRKPKLTSHQQREARERLGGRDATQRCSQLQRQSGDDFEARSVSARQRLIQDYKMRPLWQVQSKLEFGPAHDEPALLAIYQTGDVVVSRQLCSPVIGR